MKHHLTADGVIFCVMPSVDATLSCVLADSVEFPESVDIVFPEA